MVGVEDRLHRVQRAGADVAEDDAERAERERGDPDIVMATDRRRLERIGRFRRRGRWRCLVAHVRGAVYGRARASARVPPDARAAAGRGRAALRAERGGPGHRLARGGRQPRGRTGAATRRRRSTAASAARPTTPAASAARARARRRRGRSTTHAADCAALIERDLRAAGRARRALDGLADRGAARARPARARRARDRDGHVRAQDRLHPRVGGGRDRRCGAPASSCRRRSRRRTTRCSTTPPRCSATTSCGRGSSPR